MKNVPEYRYNPDKIIDIVDAFDQAFKKSEDRFIFKPLSRDVRSTEDLHNVKHVLKNLFDVMRKPRYSWYTRVWALGEHAALSIRNNMHHKSIKPAVYALAQYGTDLHPTGFDTLRRIAKSYPDDGIKGYEYAINDNRIRQKDKDLAQKALDKIKMNQNKSDLTPQNNQLKAPKIPVFNKTAKECLEQIYLKKQQAFYKKLG